MVLIGADISILSRDCGKPFVPKSHRIIDAVGLGRRSNVIAAQATRQFEGVANDAVGAAARENRLLYHDLISGAGVQPPANLRVLALGVLAHDPEVDIAGFAIPERRNDTGKQTNR